MVGAGGGTYTEVLEVVGAGGGTYTEVLVVGATYVELVVGGTYGDGALVLDSGLGCGTVTVC